MSKTLRRFSQRVLQHLIYVTLGVDDVPLILYLALGVDKPGGPQNAGGRYAHRLFLAIGIILLQDFFLRVAQERKIEVLIFLELVVAGA
jgi:hypothetical protein